MRCAELLAPTCWCARRRAVGPGRRTGRRSTRPARQGRRPRRATKDMLIDEMGRILQEVSPDLPAERGHRSSRRDYVRVAAEPGPVGGGWPVPSRAYGSCVVGGGYRALRERSHLPTRTAAGSESTTQVARAAAIRLTILMRLIVVGMHVSRRPRSGASPGVAYSASLSPVSGRPSCVPAPPGGTGLMLLRAVLGCPVRRPSAPTHHGDERAAPAVGSCRSLLRMAQVTRA